MRRKRACTNCCEVQKIREPVDKGKHRRRRTVLEKNGGARGRKVKQQCWRRALRKGDAPYRMLLYAPPLGLTASSYIAMGESTPGPSGGPGRPRKYATAEEFRETQNSAHRRRRRDKAAMDVAACPTEAALKFTRNFNSGSTEGPTRPQFRPLSTTSHFKRASASPLIFASPGIRVVSLIQIT